MGDCTTCGDAISVVRKRMGLSSIVRRSVVASCAYFVVSDWQAGRRVRRGDIKTRSGTRHVHGDLETSLRYVDRVFEDYKQYGRIDKFGGRICEIGPGDNFGVGLRCLGDGASEVVAIDRFYPERDLQYQRQIYGALAERHNLWSFFEGTPDEATLKRVSYRPGTPAEDYFAQDCGSFDYIISRAVFEHLSDPMRSLSQMYDHLAPGGTMIHRIDLRDHGLFPYHHPLTFLTVPGVVYPKMVSNTGKPNRALAHRYRSWLASTDCTGSVQVSRLVGEPTEYDPADWEDLPADAKARALSRVSQVRARLAREFGSVGDEDLATSGIVLVARKRAANSLHQAANEETGG